MADDPEQPEWFNKIMRLQQSESEPPVALQRLVRDCRCKYQNEKPWGYEIQKWVGGRKSWKFVTNSANPELAAKSAARYSHVLIRCNGCGNELVREVPNGQDDRCRP